MEPWGQSLQVSFVTVLWLYHKYLSSHCFISFACLGLLKGKFSLEWHIFNNFSLVAKLNYSIHQCMDLLILIYITHARVQAGTGPLDMKLYILIRDMKIWSNRNQSKYNNLDINVSQYAESSHCIYNAQTCCATHSSGLQWLFQKW